MAAGSPPGRGDLRRRFNVVERGRPDGQPMVFAHGFGCDQQMWRHVVPAFEADFRIVLFDYLGFGRSDASAYDAERHRSLDGYAEDVLAICDELDLHEVVLVGHSVSAMIGVLAAIEEPDRFDRLVLVAPSPSFIDDGDYVGGFSAADIDGLLETLSSNYVGWSKAMAPVIMDNPDRPELGAELEAAFCQADPKIAEEFARVTFLSDTRAELARVRTPTLVLQCKSDAIAPVAVGEFVHRSIPGSELVVLDAVGHCPNLSEPAQTVEAIAAFAR